MLGMIATFMDQLHLSYDDVVYRIPYRMLVIMQRDKQHEALNGKVHHISGKEMARRRKQRKL